MLKNDQAFLAGRDPVPSQPGFGDSLGSHEVPHSSLKTDHRWLVEHLPGADNALWRQGLELFERRAFGDLIQEMGRWGDVTDDACRWHGFGPTAEQTRSLAEGMRRVLLAAAYLGDGRRTEFHEHLQEAVRAYHLSVAARE